MKVSSISRWVSTDGSTGYISLESGSADTIILYRNDGSQVSCPLVSFDGSLSYKVPSGYLSESFDLLSGGSVVVRYRVPAHKSAPMSTVPQRGQVPSTPLESRVIENTVYRVWRHWRAHTNVTGQDFPHKVTVSNAIPWAASAYQSTRKVSDNHVFHSCFKPEPATRDDVNKALSDPVALYDGDRLGKCLYIKDEDKVVILLSDRRAAWTLEMSRSEFITYDFNLKATDTYTSEIVSTQMHVKGSRPHPGIDHDRVDTLEYVDRDSISYIKKPRNASMSQFSKDITDVDVPVIGLSVASKGLNSDVSRGCIYDASDNFARLS